MTDWDQVQYKPTARTIRVRKHLKLFLPLDNPWLALFACPGNDYVREYFVRGRLILDLVHRLKVSHYE